MQFFDEQLQTSDLKAGCKIHGTAIVAKGAEFGADVLVGPHAVIGPEVKLGDGVQVGAGAIIEGQTSIGSGTRVFPYATVGVIPQDLKYNGETATLEIGENNQIREYVNISIGTEGGGGVTRIGNDNLFMVYTHIAHDCIIGSNCIFANSVQIAGHVEIGDGAVFGGMAGGHQFCRFGDHVMVAAGSVVVQDVPPYCMVQGDRASPTGLNVVGLRRLGVNNTTLKGIKHMYRLVFGAQITVEDAIKSIEAEVESFPERQVFVDFLRNSKRGLCR